MRSSFRPARAGVVTARTAVILAIACVIGAAAGALTYLAFHSLPQALLAAGTATGGSANFLGRIIGTEPESERMLSGQEDKQHDDQEAAPCSSRRLEDPSQREVAR